MSKQNVSIYKKRTLQNHWFTPRAKPAFLACIMLIVAWWSRPEMTVSLFTPFATLKAISFYTDDYSFTCFRTTTYLLNLFLRRGNQHRPQRLRLQEQRKNGMLTLSVSPPNWMDSGSLMSTKRLLTQFAAMGMTRNGVRTLVSVVARGQPATSKVKRMPWHSCEEGAVDAGLRIATPGNQQLSQHGIPMTFVRFWGNEKSC
jgi:hypothetical protein